MGVETDSRDLPEASTQMVASQWELASNQEDPG